MLVDKSHSKKDLIILFKKHGVIIDDKLSKGNIIKNIESYIDEFKFTDKIKNATELKDYLKNTSPKQRPNTTEKNDIMDEATYTNKDDPYHDIMSIYMWGDLPSVRRACRMYNNSYYCNNHVNPIISNEIQEELNNNKFIKQKILYKMTIRRATEDNPIILTFD
jgi:hypothetical protein